jgi:4-coumarate--CoA ligase
MFVPFISSHEKILRMTPDDCILAFLPFYHAYGLVVKVAFALHSGAKLITISKFEAEPFLRFIEEHRVS